MRILSVLIFHLSALTVLGNSICFKDSLTKHIILSSASEQKMMEKERAIEEILQSMIAIPQGKFNLGCSQDQGLACSSDEFPVHEVSLSAFYLSNSEVTQGWWKAIMGDNPASFCRSDNFPVEMVIFFDVEVFIDSLNKASGLTFRLPTEAEWEYAARGADALCNNKYSGSSDPGNVAWSNKNSYQKTHVVKLKMPNQLGIYDMSGNVWEWVADWYGKYSGVAQSDPRGPASGVNKVVRGGSWAGSPDFCRNSIRHSFPPDFKSAYVGFRLALDELNQD